MFETPDFTDSFVAIDFETANANRGSACSVGLAFVEDGKIVRAEEHLMRPPATVDYFEQFNISIHGITPGMVKSKPRFSEIMPKLLGRIGDRTVVAHNAGFDLSVLRGACHLSDLEWPTLTYLCTKVLSRTILNLEYYSLPCVARALQLILKDHHNAKADAICTAEIVLALCGKVKVFNLDELLDKQKVKQGILYPTGWERCQRASDDDGIPDANPYADPRNIVSGKHFAITGRLSGYKKQALYNMVATLGGYSQSDITHKTDFLVIGDWETNKPLPNATSQKRYHTAMAFSSIGNEIEVISGRDFLRLLSKAQDFS